MELATQGLESVGCPVTLLEQDGEDRAGWIARVEAEIGTIKSELDEEERAAILSHVRASDYPETSSRWRALAGQAGFGTAREIYLAPTELERVYCFRD